MTKPVIVTRAGKGSALTFEEGDSNFTNLRDATITVNGDTGNVPIDLNGSFTITGGVGLTATALSGNITVDLDDTAVSAGSYTIASITVDAQGRITAASSGSPTTDNISEGTTNLYWTSARGDANFASNLSTTTTDDVAEGTTNKYFSNTLARGAFSASTGITITDGAIATTITQYSNSDARTAISVQDNGGEGSLSYDNGTGVISYTGPDLSGYEQSSNKGQPNGYASLDANGQVPSSQLPSFVDDVLEYANAAALPVTGETGKIYITLDDNKSYRWSGSIYVEISASPGSTDAVTEGSTNLYFTTARARASFTAGTGISITDGEIASTLTVPSNLDDLGDVQINGTPTQNQVLQFMGTYWENQTLNLPDTLGSLSDVNATTPSNGDILVYNSGTLQWQSQAPASGGISNVVDDTSPQLGGDLDGQGQVVYNVSLKQYTEYVHSLGSTDTPTLNYFNGNVQTITITSGLSLPAFTNAASGQSITLLVTGTGTATGTGAYKFAGGSKTLTNYSVVSIFYDGTNYWTSIATDFQA